MHLEYRIDICEIELFANDMMEIKTNWRMIYHVNGGWYCGFPVNETTTNYMINQIGANGKTLEHSDFFIHIVEFNYWDFKN